MLEKDKNAAVNIQNIVFQRNKQRSQGSEEKKAYDYSEILAIVRQKITMNHSAELAGIVNQSENRPLLINLITRYLNSEQLVSPENMTTLIEEIYEDMAGLAFLQTYNQDPAVEEININSYDNIWVYYPDRKIRLDKVFNSPEECASIVKKMAHMGHTILDGSKPYGDSYLSRGVRMSGAIAPAVDPEHGAAGSIRKQKISSITRRTLIDSGTVTADMLEFVSLCINNGVSVAFAGATGSGKTANMGYLLSTVENETRIYSIEDTKELSLAKYENGIRVNDVVQLYTRTGSNPITMLDLLKISLRFHPDIIVPAEMRGAEALTAQEAGRTGHTIVSSLHANGAIDAYDRILTMCQEANTNLSEERLLKNIIEAFPIVVFARKMKDQTRKWIEIYEGVDCVNGEIIGHTLYKFRPQKTMRDENGTILKIEGEHIQENAISQKLQEKFRMNGVEEKIIQRYAIIRRNAV